MIKKQSKDPKTQRLIIPRNYTFFISLIPQHYNLTLFISS